MVGAILLQSGKGAEIGASFGGSSQTVFGSRGPRTFEQIHGRRRGRLHADCAQSGYPRKERAFSSTVIDLNKKEIPQTAPETPSTTPAAPATESHAPSNSSLKWTLAERWINPSSSSVNREQDLRDRRDSRRRNFGPVLLFSRVSHE